MTRNNNSVHIFQKVRRKNFESFYHKEMAGWVPVVHAYNPSCSRGRDQEDHSSKPARAKSSMRLSILKKPSQKSEVKWVVQGGGPEFKPQYWKKKADV
jgi:hypothetical protein